MMCVLRINRETEWLLPRGVTRTVLWTRWVFRSHRTNRIDLASTKNRNLEFVPYILRVYKIYGNNNIKCRLTT